MRVLRIRAKVAHGKTALVSAYSDRDPGSFYPLDTETRKASYKVPVFLMAGGDDETASIAKTEKIAE